MHPMHPCNRTSASRRGQHARGSEPEILTEIYQDAVNIAIWETEISTKLESAVKSVMASSYDFQLSEVILIKSAEDQLQKILGVTTLSQSCVTMY